MPTIDEKNVELNEGILTALHEKLGRSDQPAPARGFRGDEGKDNVAQPADLLNQLKAAFWEWFDSNQGKELFKKRVRILFVKISIKVKILKPIFELIFPRSK